MRNLLLTVASVLLLTTAVTPLFADIADPQGYTNGTFNSTGSNVWYYSSPSSLTFTGVGSLGSPVNWTAPNPATNVLLGTLRLDNANKNDDSLYSGNLTFNVNFTTPSGVLPFTWQLSVDAVKHVNDILLSLPGAGSEQSVTIGDTLLTAHLDGWFSSKTGESGPTLTQLVVSDPSNDGQSVTTGYAYLYGDITATHVDTVPEPGSISLFGTTLVGACYFIRRRFVKI